MKIVTSKLISAFFLAASVIFAVAPSGVQAEGPKWQGSLPSQGKDSRQWMELLGELRLEGMAYGSLAAASRMLNFFQDLPTKEMAYRTTVELIDQGYPFSVQSMFVAGDIEPEEDYDFANSYHLYKYILNRKVGMDKWAQHYFSKVDSENFPKYLFYQALQAYQKKDLSQAESLLKKILAKDLPKSQAAFARRVSRTLARIYFEREQYAKSSEIYNSFLLKMNPVSPEDWLESAWSLYHLKRFEEALGALYNLESRSVGNEIYLEKYTIRALIYRATCAVPSAEALTQNFERKFGPAIAGLKSGESISKYPILNQLDVPGNASYRQINQTLAKLQKEKQELKKLSSSQQKLAEYLYDSEIQMLSRTAGIYAEKANDRAARQLIGMSEQLKFLKFDIARERFNPDSVFKTAQVKAEPLVEDLRTNHFKVRWAQRGDFWRDERLEYKGVVPNQCLN